ncbi:LysE family transporter [Maritimibacter sp. DP07]|jgi:threonine/homoserine/homoserine lactone efflux protein|uniref:LysE family transporter n=1 Tax=Maritimibacter harenae TaxID=2606218 RepID=A0A845M762_9RHOB|nr:LysE family translocator [Maritimibacter harenae]MZR15132.1 LysE family transporter [Maritimibacter harenae]
MILGLDPSVVLAFVGAGIVLNLTPGADVMFASASGLSGGPRAGAAAALGVALGALMHTVLAAAGLSALIAASPVLFELVRWAGAGYLLFLAWKAWRAGAVPAQGGETRLIGAIRRGFLTNALNPKVALFILALLPQFTAPGAGPLWAQILALGAIFSVTGFVITAGYGMAAGLLGARLNRHARALNRVSAVVYGGLALRLVLTGGAK